MPFKMQAAVSKRTVASTTYEVPKRSRLAPPAAGLLKDIELPTRVVPHTIPASAAMTVVIYKASDCAGDSIPDYAGVEAGLFEVMMEHVAYPSFLYRARFEFDGFLRYAHHTAADEAPASLEDMDTAAGHLVFL